MFGALSSRPLRFVLLFWIILAGALAVRTALRPASHTVFPVFASGAAHWWAGEPLYADYRPVLDHFRYPPLLAVAMTPFQLLGLTVGGIVWAWCSLGLFVLALAIFLRGVAPEVCSPSRQAAFFVLATVGGLRSLWNGQSNTIAVALLLLGVAACVRGQSWRAALWLSASLQIKLTALPVVLLFALLWPRRLAGRIALVTTAGCLLPFLAGSPAWVVAQYHDFLTQLSATSAERWLGFRDGWTVVVVARHLWSGAADAVPLRAPLDSTSYRIVQLLTAVLVAAWCWRQHQRNDSVQRSAILTLGMGVAWLLLFGPAVEQPTFIFLAPVLAWALVRRDLWPAGWPLLVTAALLILVLGWSGFGRLHPLLLLALPLGTTLFAAWWALATEQTLATRRPAEWYNSWSSSLSPDRSGFGGKGPVVSSPRTVPATERDAHGEHVDLLPLRGDLAAS